MPCFYGCQCENCKALWAMPATKTVAVRYPLFAKMEGSAADHPVATEREAVAGRVAQIIGDFGAGRVPKAQAVEVKRAAERAIADHDVARSIGKL